jgi:hypothetical protein
MGARVHWSLMSANCLVKHNRHRNKNYAYLQIDLSVHTNLVLETLTKVPCKFGLVLRDRKKFV